VDFVNRLRGAQRIVAGAVLHPVVVVPLVVEIPDHAGRARRFFVQKPEGIGLVDVVAVAARFDVKFVESAFGYAGDEAFPDTGTAARGEEVGVGAPVVEAADHGD